MGRKSIETLVGLFVLIGALAVVFLALKAANLASFTTGATYNVKASLDRKSTRLNSSHIPLSRMPSSA